MSADKSIHAAVTVDPAGSTTVTVKDAKDANEISVGDEVNGHEVHPHTRVEKVEGTTITLNAATIALKEGKTTDAKLVFLHTDEFVYDVSEYLDEHPGGAEVLQEEAGKCMDVDGSDATHMFDSIGHTSGAKKTRDTYVIGKLKVDPAKAKLRKSKVVASGGGGGLSMTAVFVVLLAIALGIFYTQYLGK